MGAVRHAVLAEELIIYTIVPTRIGECCALQKKIMSWAASKNRSICGRAISRAALTDYIHF